MFLHLKKNSPSNALFNTYRFNKAKSSKGIVWKQVL